MKSALCSSAVQLVFQSFTLDVWFVAHKLQYHLLICFMSSFLFSGRSRAAKFEAETRLRGAIHAEDFIMFSHTSESRSIKDNCQPVTLCTRLIQRRSDVTLTHQRPQQDVSEPSSTSSFCPTLTAAGGLQAGCSSSCRLLTVATAKGQLV